MNIEELSNEALLAAYSKGQFQAFDAFYKRNSKIIFLFLTSLTGNQQEAEDALQETFIRIHKYIHRYNDQKNALSWVFTIAKNELFRISKQKHYHCDLDDHMQKFRAQVSIEAREQLQEIFSRLSREERQLIEEKYVVGLDYNELSYKHRISIPSARKKVSRILKKIRAVS